MDWQIAIGIYILFTSVFALFYRETARKFPGTAISSTAVMYTTGMGPAAVIWAIIFRDVSFDFPTSVWLFVATNTVLFAAANFTAFAASSVVDAAQFNIIGNLGTVTTILFSSIILHEMLSMLQGVGAFFIFAAAVLIGFGNSSKRSIRMNRHTIVAVLSGFFWGIWVVNEKYLLDNMTFSTALLLGWGVQALSLSPFVYSYAKSSILSEESVNLKHVKITFISGVLRASAGIAFFYALRESGNASVFSGIVAYRTVLIVLGSYFILNEKDYLKSKILGSTLATAGLLILI